MYSEVFSIFNVHAFYYTGSSFLLKKTPVLIESDWNLKKFLSLEEILGMGVLIESDWNLKDTKDCIIVVPAGINRIRLEFKGYMAAMLKGSQEVLIESDWNLKTVVSRAINRAIQKY